MALIIETGAGISGANSYISTADAQSHLDSREFESSPVMSDGLLLRAMDQLANVRWSGSKTSATNALPWPRSSVYDCEGRLIASDVIPDQIKEAQVWLAYYISLGSDPAAVSTPAITSETVDVLSVDYATKAGDTTAVTLLSLPNVKTRLQCLTRSSGGIDRA